MYVGLYATCVWNWNWWLTQDHFLMKHWSQHKHRCSGPVVGLEEYSLRLVSRYSTVRSGTLLGVSEACGFLVPMHEGACETGSQIPRALARGIWRTVRTSRSTSPAAAVHLVPFWILIKFGGGFTLRKLWLGCLTNFGWKPLLHNSLNFISQRSTSHATQSFITPGEPKFPQLFCPCMVQLGSMSKRHRVPTSPGQNVPGSVKTYLGTRSKRPRVITCIRAA